MNDFIDKKWVEYARGLNERDVMDTYISEIQNITNNFSPKVEKLIKKSLSEIVEIYSKKEDKK